MDALVAAAAGGDVAAFAALYARYRSDVHATVRRVLHNQSDAEDATQQVFLNALRGLNSYQPDRAPFGAWLNGIASHHAVNLHRAAARSESREAPAGDDTSERFSARPDADLLADEGFRLLLAQLPKEQRAVIFLRYQFDWSNAEIGRTIGRSAAAVAQLHRRALLRLEAEMPPAEAKFHA